MCIFHYVPFNCVPFSLYAFFIMAFVLIIFLHYVPSALCEITIFHYVHIYYCYYKVCNKWTRCAVKGIADKNDQLAL